MPDNWNVTLSPHARIVKLVLDGSTRTARVTLQGSEDARAISADAIRALFGARVAQEAFHPGTPLHAFLTASTWPRRLRPHMSVPAAAEEEYNLALALRVQDVDELWYLVAESFNFRAALGADAAYATEPNLRTLVRRLASFAPNATRDAFVSALIANTPLPPPIPSLAELFQTSRSE